VDFAMGHACLRAPALDVVRSDSSGFALRFTDRMDGAVERRGVETPLANLGEEVERAREVALEPGDVARVDLGGVWLEAFFARVPRLPAPSLADSVDYTLVNPFLVLLFAFAIAVIAATTREAGAVAADDIGSQAATLEKVMVRAAPPVVVRPVALAQGRREPEPAALAHSGREGSAGSPAAPERPARASNLGRPAADSGRELVQRLFGGRDSIANAVAGIHGLGGDLLAAMGHLKGPVTGDARGAWGMGLEGDGPGGGGPAESTSVGPELRTNGRGTDPSYGTGPRNLPQGPRVAPEIGSGPIIGCGEGLPCLDKELIRRVIHRNRAQLRYCYEVALTRKPTLKGKVSVAFTIAAQGAVTEAGIASSDVGDPAMESCVVSRVRGWLFPRVPAGWVKVTYPFVFHPAGE
jgi:TonB family protein